MSTEIVVIADIIQSRKKFDPKEWQSFHDGIKWLNEIFVSNLKSPITVYSGDSFGTVSKDLYSAVSLVLKLPEFILKYNSRIVLIEDVIDFGLAEINIVNLEGPAVWKSQEYLEKIKNKELFFGMLLQNESNMTIIENWVNIILVLKQNWSPIQRVTYRLYANSLSQKDIAKTLGKSQQYISKIIKKNNFQIVLSNEKALMNLVYKTSIK